MGDIPRYLLSGIPANREGRRFLSRLRGYLNRDAYSIILRGSGPRAAPARKNGVHPSRYRQSLPLSEAKTMRLYVNTKPGATDSEADMLRARLRMAQDDIGRLRLDLGDADENIRRARFQRDCREHDFDHATGMLSQMQELLHARERALSNVPAWIVRFFNWLDGRLP
jgi:hypothetical protein